MTSSDSLSILRSRTTDVVSLMAEDLFYGGGVFAVLQKMGGVGMTQGMDGGRFADGALSHRYPEGGLDVADVDVAVT